MQEDLDLPLSFDQCLTMVLELIQCDGELRIWHGNWGEGEDLEALLAGFGDRWRGNRKTTLLSI